MAFNPYIVEIESLVSNKIHSFEFDVDSQLFAHFGSVEVQKGNAVLKINLDKSIATIEALLSIKGFVELICDRSGDEFDYQIDITHKIIFKFSDKNEMLDEDIYFIEHGTRTLDFTQIIYDLILLSVPMKKLHPRYSDEDPAQEHVFVFGDLPSIEETPVADPRWEVLRNLKKI